MSEKSTFPRLGFDEDGEWHIPSPAKDVSLRQYRQLRHAMVGLNPDIRSALSVHDSSFDGEWYLHRKPYPTTSYDHSFTRQMHDLLTQYTGLSEPDGFAVTAMSAVPVDDSVRAYYRYMRRAEPVIQYVRSGNYNALRWDDDTYPFGFYEPVDTVTEQREIQRLRSHYGTCDHVCVIDQYVNTGFALQYAGDLLKAAGVPKVTLMHGMWYFDALPKAVRLENTSSSYAFMMQNIGKLAAQATRQYL